MELVSFIENCANHNIPVLVCIIDQTILQIKPEHMERALTRSEYVSQALI
jgi:hypothetical protein